MKKVNILFIVGNNYYPNDNRVHNECIALSKEDRFKCFVLAPRNSKEKEKLFDILQGVTCFRFPYFESNSMKTIVLEYVILLFWFLFYVPLIVLFKRIKIIHVANPPDFILPSFFWLKLFGIKLIFDQHDLSIEQFNMRSKKNSIKSKIFLPILFCLEKWSIKLSNLVIATNTSLKKYELKIAKNKEVIIVRNSNIIQYSNIIDIPKNKNDKLHLGYFGSLSYHPHAGIENLRNIAFYLKKKEIDFTFSIIGSGGGITILKDLLKKDNLESSFKFYGWMNLDSAFNEIIHFDFGILPWTVTKANNMHTSAKLMDYMCCATPVCSLKLTEQMRTTDGIGIHVDSFENMVDEIIKVYNDNKLYEKLREKTLSRFNKNLCWEKQATILINGYKNFL